ncbi:tryptophan halogenase family protein [Brevundimonas sp. Root1279]|uniref:tryptophan halogenase family protein n=1 Tax=Brevundimonas sp. Root1279 TaxID=1736443 RepID=UPI000700B85A|nr:tryptophan halogenase family protein [Brevundimonas sp. Root1279]KQW78760.1 tryptophan halogenase [Brevundimonas sp. Root1279]
MTRPLQVVIVGGGTAGWMTASGLVGSLTQQQVQVRLVESDEIGIVGVGEATLPQMREFNDLIGIVESDMMRKTNATFKLGIEFRDWGFKGSNYVHPFGAHGHPMGGVAFHHQWTRARLNGQAEDIGDYSFAIVASRRNRFDFPADDKSAINSTFDYAYHFDAGLYARYLRGWAEARGLVRTEGKVVDVTLDPHSGDVASVTLESGEVIAGDLFIDCSGFRGLIIGQALNGPFEEWGKWLPCDRALAVPTERSADFTPYTRSTALEAGWQWRIPLQHRTGNGYVYSSAFISDDEAHARLMGNLDGKPLAEPRPIKFKSGRRTASWTKNCIAVGLASGFLEPLESTSIYLTQVAVTTLLKLLPRGNVDPALAAEFNRRIDNEYDRVRDFLILHYQVNARQDGDLWRQCREMEIPDSLREKMALFEHRGHIAQYKDGLFSPPSWLSVFVGQGMSPRGYHPMTDRMPLDQAAAEMADIRRRISDRVDAMPAHDVFVADYCGGEAPQRAAGAGA